jgi:hypothetical protein
LIAAVVASSRILQPNVFQSDALIHQYWTSWATLGLLAGTLVLAMAATFALLRVSRARQPALGAVLTGLTLVGALLSSRAGVRAASRGRPSPSTVISPPFPRSRC